MKKNYIFLFILAHFSAFAQQQEPTSFSLKQAIDYALEENFSVKNSTLQSQMANAKKGEVQGRLLPQINGNMNYTHSFQVQRNIVEGGTGLFSTYPTGSVVPLQLSLPNVLLPSVTASQVLFDKASFTAQDSVKASQQIASKNITKSKIDVTVNVTKAYYGVLVNEKQLKDIEKNLQRTDSLYKETSSRLHAGLARNIDVSRILVSLNNIRQEREKINRTLKLSRSTLRYQMNVSNENPLVLTDSLHENQITEIGQSVKQELGNSLYTNRIEYSIIESQLLLNKYELKSTAARRYPRLLATASIGYNPGATHLEDITQSARWIQYSTVGFSLQVPIFSGLATNYRIKQRKIQQSITENNKLALEKEINLEVEQALINLNNSIESFKIQKDNLGLAQQNLTVLRAEYESGIALNIEVVSAEAALIDAQTSFYNSVYETLVAKADYDKATGNILK